KLASGEFDQRRIDDVLSKAAPALARIHAIQEKHDCVFITGLTADATFPHAFAVPTVARLAVLQMKQSRASGDMRAVEAAIRRALRLSRDPQPRGLDVCQLVSMSIDDNVIQGIQRLVLTDPELTVEHIDRI